MECACILECRSDNDLVALRFRWRFFDHYCRPDALLELMDDDHHADDRLYWHQSGLFYIVPECLYPVPALEITHSVGTSGSGLGCLLLFLCSLQAAGTHVSGGMVHGTYC